MLVAGFAGHTDMTHAHEVANEVRHISKQFKECQMLAQTYNTRERLLGLPATNVSKRESIKSCIYVYVNIYVYVYSFW